MDFDQESALRTEAEGISHLHRSFADRYLIHFNATKALLQTSGLNPGGPGSAHSMAFEILQREDVKAYLRLAMEYRSAKLGISAERILKRLETLAFSNIIATLRDSPDGTIRVRKLEDLPEPLQTCIKKIRQIPVQGGDGEIIDYRVEVDLHDPMPALRMLFSYLGLDNSLEAAEKTLRRLRGIDRI